jgi:hypothetical protein
MSVWTFIIYGSETKPAANPSAGYCLKSALDTLVTGGTAATFTIQPLGLYPQPELETEVTKYLGGYRTASKNVMIKFSLKDILKDYPSSLTSLDDYYPLEVLKYPYTWINIPSNYYLVPDELKSLTVANYCIEVIPTAISTAIQDSTKQITIELTKAYDE